MGIKQLNLEALHSLEGGKTAAMFDEHLKRAALDCEDRPGDATKRVVTLTVEMTPMLDLQTLECSEVSTQVIIKSVVPAHRTKAYNCGLRKNGVVVYNEDSPEDIDQATLFDGEKQT